MKKIVMSISIIAIVLFSAENLNAMKRKKEEPEKGAQQPSQPVVPVKKAKTLKKLARETVVKSFIEESFAKLPEELREEVAQKPLFYGNTVLHVITNPVDIQPLLQAGADRNALNDDLQTPFNYYIMQGKLPAAHQLLALTGGTLNLEADMLGNTPLMNAIKQGDLELAKKIIEYLNQKDASTQNSIINSYNISPNEHAFIRYQTALILAIRFAPQLVPILLANGADPNFAFPLTIAARYHPAEVQLLLDAGAMVDSPNSRGETALMYAKNDRVAEQLIKSGADLYAEDMDGSTAATTAAIDRRTKTLLKILEHGYDINHQTSDGETVLHFAAFDGNIKLIELLLSKKADITLRDRNNQGVLYKFMDRNISEELCDSFDENDMEKLRYLLEKGATVLPIDLEKAAECPPVLKFFNELGFKI